MIAGVAAAQGAETRVFLSWGSPYGTPGARDTLVRACGDSARVDTLCLSFEPGEDLPDMVAIAGVLEVHPPAGDTLADYWSFVSEARGPGGCRAEFSGSGEAGCPFPWSSQGLSGVRYERRDGAAFIRFLYAVPIASHVKLLAGVRYCVARILLQHRAGGGQGCDQPLRLVWSDADLGAFPDKLKRIINGRQRPVFLRAR